MGDIKASAAEDAALCNAARCFITEAYSVAAQEIQRLTLIYRWIPG